MKSSDERFFVIGEIFLSRLVKENDKKDKE